MNPSREEISSLKEAREECLSISGYEERLRSFKESFEELLKNLNKKGYISDRFLETTLYRLIRLGRYGGYGDIDEIFGILLKLNYYVKKSKDEEIILKFAKVYCLLQLLLRHERDVSLNLIYLAMYNVFLSVYLSLGKVD